MPELQTKNFGNISIEPDSELSFPAGFPGFEERRRFVALTFAETNPLVYLQSLEQPDLCFITLPILAADPQYRLRVSEEDISLLGFLPHRQPVMGDDVLCLAVLSLRETGPTANLLAPVVVNLKTRTAVQAVCQEPDYSLQFALMPQEAVVCS
jgi:flagellar assembly factor FliW